MAVEAARVEREGDPWREDELADLQARPLAAVFARASADLVRRSGRTEASWNGAPSPSTTTPSPSA